MADVSQFLNTGGGGSGFPETPRGSGVDSFGSRRYIPIKGTNLGLRTPAFFSNSGNSTLGWTMVENTPTNVGTTQWTINWNTIASNKGWNATNMSNNCVWGYCCINNNSVYLMFTGGDGLSANISTVWICKASITTGAISEVKEVNLSNVTILDGFPASVRAKLVIGSFWEISDSGNLSMSLARSDSGVLLTKGIAQVVLSSNYSTLIEQTRLYRLSTNQQYLPSNIKYRTADGKLTLGSASRTDPVGSPEDAIWIAHSSKGLITINVDNSADDLLYLDFIQQILGQDSLHFTNPNNPTQASDFNVIVNNDVVFWREVADRSLPNNTMRLSMDRSKLDNYLAKYWKAYTGEDI